MGKKIIIKVNRNSKNRTVANMRVFVRNMLHYRVLSKHVNGLVDLITACI